MPPLSRRAALALVAAGMSRTAVAQPGLADAPFIDAFGPVGTADDTATFNAALRSGEPFRLRARAYSLAGPVANGGAAVVMHGVPGATRLVCAGLASGTWFRLQTGRTIDIDGVTWDGGGARTGSDVGMVAIGGDPAACALRRCAFLRGSNPAGLLLSLAAGGPDNPLITLDAIEAAGNAGSGIWIEHGVNMVLTALRLHDNREGGLRCQRYGNRAGAPLRRLVVRDSFAWNNGQGGFGVGVYNEAPGGSPAVLGPNLPDAVDATLADLFAWNNGGYGIYAGAENVRIIGCRTARNGPDGGIAANAKRCVIQNCEVTEERGFGIDVGGSYEVDVSQNRLVEIDGVGINAGGGYMVTGSDNRMIGCTGPAVAVWNTEYGGGGWLQYRMNHLRLVGTTIDMSRLADTFAIDVRDGASNIAFEGVDAVEARRDGRPPRGPGRVLRAATRSIRIGNIRYNGSGRLAVQPEAGVLTVPDMADSVVLPAGAQTLSQVRTQTMARVGTGIGWIAVTEGGRGYDPMRSGAVLEGDGDVAAVGKLEPNIWTGGGGQLIGFRLRAPGTGFTRATVRMTGPGSGARIAVQIGIPLPAERRLRLLFPGGGRLSGGLPAASIPPGGTIELAEYDGRWTLGPPR